jgi:hypothetical protein
MDKDIDNRNKNCSHLKASNQRLAGIPPEHIRQVLLWFYELFDSNLKTACACQRVVLEEQQVDRRN